MMPDPDPKDIAAAREICPSNKHRSDPFDPDVMSWDCTCPRVLPAITKAREEGRQEEREAIAHQIAMYQPTMTERATKMDRMLVIVTCQDLAKLIRVRTTGGEDESK